MSQSEIDKTVSIVILTYNRPAILDSLLTSLQSVSACCLEVIVIDNNSDNPVTDIANKYDYVRLITLPVNIGVGGRNRGISAAQGDVVITLDDDVSGITEEEINCIVKILGEREIAAVCFKVIDAETREIIDWGHHRLKEEFSECTFVTDDISEGAVAYRRDIAIRAGLYAEEFFISHEGPDLALRIMNLGYKILYSPDITVLHSHSSLGRTSWRRYYYDTRNLIWLILRNYPFWGGCRKLFIGLSAMAVYSLRDGYFRFWFFAIADALKGAKWAIDTRIPMAPCTIKTLKEISQYRPSITYLVKKRLFRKKLGI